ncbi:MAG: 50S ribosomal protein L18 [Armatimonadota bacterium]|nr:50S ribosomal protein L18 [Armatimonadota bacterium]
MLRRTDRNLLRKRRHLRVRQRVSGTVTRPRLVVFRSLGHIYAQVVDDGQGHTLAAASTLDPELREQVKGKRKVEASRLVGELIARRARERGITRVVFDRAGYAYHGRVKALAEGARAGGLEF